MEVIYWKAFASLAEPSTTSPESRKSKQKPEPPLKRAPAQSSFLVSGLLLSLATPTGFLGPPLHSSPGHSEQGVHEVHVGSCGLLSKGSGSFLGSLGLLGQFLHTPPTKRVHLPHGLDTALL